ILPRLIVSRTIYGPARVPARHARNPDPPYTALRTAARLRNRATHPADIRGRARRRSRLSLPSPPTPGIAEAHHGEMGNQRHQTQSPLLPVDSGRPQTPQRFHLSLGRLRPCNVAGPETRKRSLNHAVPRTPPPPSPLETTAARAIARRRT